MSEWIVCKDKSHVSLSADGNQLEILIEQNNFGNVYIEIPVAYIAPLLKRMPKKAKGK